LSVRDEHLDMFSPEELLAAQLMASEPPYGKGVRRFGLVVKRVNEAGRKSGWSELSYSRMKSLLTEDFPRAKAFRELVDDFRPLVREQKLKVVQENLAVEIGRRLTVEQVRSALLGRLWAIVNAKPEDALNEDGEPIPFAMMPPETQLAVSPTGRFYDPMKALDMLQKQMKLDQNTETGEVAISEEGMLDTKPVPDHLLNPKGAQEQIN